MKSGIVILSEIVGPLAERLHAVQRRYDPRMAAELPPHLTITGSSGMGPSPADTSLEELERLLAPIAAKTPPITLKLERPMRFMQSKVVVLPIDPNGPIRALHEAIKSSGLRYEKPRFTFTPHVTLSFYPELPPERVKELLALSFDDDVVIDRIQAYRADDVGRSSLFGSWALEGKSNRSSR